MKTPRHFYLICFFVLLLSSSTAQADWLSDLKKIAKDAFNEIISSEENSQSKLSLQEVDPLLHLLPSHWQSFTVQDQVFGKEVLIAKVGKVGAPWIIFVHGLGQNGMRDWLKVVSEFEEEFQILLIDLPGFGSSPAPSKKLTPSRYSELINTLQTHFTTEPAYLVGHSMGGAVVLRYAYLYPHNIKKMFLIDVAGVLERTAFIKHSAFDRIPNGYTENSALASLLSGLKDLTGSWVEKAATMPDPLKMLSKSDLAWGAVFARTPSVNAALGLVEEDFTQAIFHSNINAHILWGKQDKIAPVRTGLLLSQVLPKSNIRWIDDAAHVPMASHTELFNKWLAEGLKLQIPELQDSSVSIPSTNASQASKGDYVCDKNANIQLTGHYNKIEINGCSAVSLTDVSVISLSITDSLVDAQNLTLMGDSQIAHSTFVVTGGYVQRDIELNDARIDFAGVTFDEHALIKVSNKSRLIMSINMRGSSKVLHGDFELQNSRL